MLDTVFIPAFWKIMTALVPLIVPIVGIRIGFGLFEKGLFGGRRRD